MPSFGTLLSKWPLIRQIREGKDGTGVESMSDKTLAMHARIDGAEVARSVCPYCGVGCGQLIYHKDGKPISIEGDPHWWPRPDRIKPPRFVMRLVGHSQNQSLRLSVTRSRCAAAKIFLKCWV